MPSLPLSPINTSFPLHQVAASEKQLTSRTIRPAVPNANSRTNYRKLEEGRKQVLGWNCYAGNLHANKGCQLPGYLVSQSSPDAFSNIKPKLKFPWSVAGLPELKDGCDEGGYNGGGYNEGGYNEAGYNEADTEPTFVRSRDFF